MITIGDIVETTYLGTRLEAGAGGIGNVVRWAHVCDMPDPEEWLAPGDLVLTTGRGLPLEPAAQVTRVERMAEANLAGIAISTDMGAPAVSPAMVAAADRHAFPVLVTTFAIPFVAISRAVTQANQEVLRVGAQQTQQLYSAVLRATVEQTAGDRLLRTLSRIVACELYVVDAETAEPLETFASAPPHELAEAWRERPPSASGSTPSIFRLALADRPVVGMTVPSTRAAVLLAVGRDSAHVDGTVLAHVSTIVALELERLWAERDRLRRSGAALLLDMVDGRLALEVAAPALRERALDGSRLRMLACSTVDGPPQYEARLHHRLAERRIPHLVALRDRTLLALIAADDRDLAAVREELDPAAAIGTSDSFGRLAHAPDAAHEAQLALLQARRDGTGISIYGQASSLVPFLPATLTEARRVAESVLGAIAGYDEAHDTHLLASLQTFLTHNRSWSRTAAVLHVHKQTVVYRMRRVEELSGRRLDHTDDVAELWLALRAYDLAGGIGTGDDQASRSTGARAHHPAR